MDKSVKTLHALNWYYGNICTRQCPKNKQREHYERMREMIRGHENFLITYKMFIKVVQEKYHVCALTDEQRYRSRRNFWKLDHSGCRDFYRRLYGGNH